MDIVRESKAVQYETIAFIDDRVETMVHGIKVVGKRSILTQNKPGTINLCVAVGNPASRRGLVEEIEPYGHSCATVIDPSAIVRPSATIGKGALILAGAVISCDVTIARYGGHWGGGAGLSDGGSVGGRGLVGAGASIQLGIRVENWASVGMGAAIYSPVANGITVIGNPARALPLMVKTGEESTISADSKIVTAPIIP